MDAFCPDWYMYFRASRDCPSVTPWEFQGFPREPVPYGWFERVLIAGNAERQAHAASIPQSRFVNSA